MLDLGASIAVYWLQLMLSSRAVESGGQVLVGMLMGSGLVDFAHAFVSRFQRRDSVRALHSHLSDRRASSSHVSTCALRRRKKKNKSRKIFWKMLTGTTWPRLVRALDSVIQKAPRPALCETHKKRLCKRLSEWKGNIDQRRPKAKPTS